VGYSAKDLMDGGFTAKEVMACGYGVAALREAGFRAIELRQLGFSARELKENGYGAAALKEAGSVVKELKELGFPDDELEEAGFSRRAVEAVDGRSTRELKEFGSYEGVPYEVAELREYGFVVADLRGVYTIKDMRDQGFDLDELRAGGMPEHAVLAVDGRSVRELRKGQYKAEVLRRIGFPLPELVEGGYTASELKRARYMPEELKQVGFTAGVLRVAGYTAKQLHAARYSLHDMHGGGYFWKELVIFLRATHAELTKAGYTGLDPLHELFMLYREKEDEEVIPDGSVLSTKRADPHMEAPTSPRGWARSASAGEWVTQRLSAQRPTSPRMIEVTDRSLKLRQGVALTSKCVGVVSQGTRLRVIDSRVWRGDGTQRVLVAAAESAEDGALSMLPLGWVTLRPPPTPSTRPPTWKSTPMAGPESAHSVVSYLRPEGHDELSA